MQHVEVSIPAVLSLFMLRHTTAIPLLIYGYFCALIYGATATADQYMADCRSAYNKSHDVSEMLVTANFNRSTFYTVCQL